MLDVPSYCFARVYPEGEDQSKLLLFSEKTQLFHIGQLYEKQPARPLKCGKCGGDNFNVAQGDYYTAIRCVSCKWELCIHEG